MQSDKRIFDDLSKFLNGVAGTVAGMGREAEAGFRERTRRARKHARAGPEPRLAGPQLPEPLDRGLFGTDVTGAHRRGTVTAARVWGKDQIRASFCTARSASTASCSRTSSRRA